MHVQALQKASCNTLTTLSQHVLRTHLKSAGNIVKPQEVETVLNYVASDQQYQHLDGLFLLLLTSNAVKQIQWLRSASHQQQLSAKKYFIHRDGTSQAMYELMPAGVAELAARSETLAW